MTINFENTESVKLPDLRKQLVAQWIKDCAEKHGFELKQITYLFASDNEVLEQNRIFLQHDFYTDIITFDACEPNDNTNVIRGDILISIDRICDNATEFRIPFDEELHRVMAHGVLHLCGFNDETDKEELEMRIAEDNALYELHKLCQGKPLLKHPYKYK